jgi:plasmid stabilization system protein ParE
VLNPRLRKQIQRIWQDVAKRKGERAAEKALGQMEQAFFQLRRHPGMGVAGTRKGRVLRRLLAGDYWIYYVETGSSVRIRQIRHYKQDQAKSWDATWD